MLAVELIELVSEPKVCDCNQNVKKKMTGGHSQLISADGHLAVYVRGCRNSKTH